MKMKLFRWIYGMAGAGLIAGTMLTGDYGLKAVDREVYEKALKLQEEIDGLGFEDFVLKDYKVRFYNGNCDYVVQEQTVTKEEAVFDTFVGTTSFVDGEYQVILPAYDDFSQLFSMMGAMESMAEGEISFDEDTYSVNAHVATLWHEAFHAWQLTGQEEAVWKMAEEAGIGEDTRLEELIVKEVDSNREWVLLFSKEMELLADAYYERDDVQKRSLIEEALQIADDRHRRMGKEEVFAECYYEMMEGSARYVEGCAYRLLEGEEAWESAYLGDFVYANGSGKYYAMGMLKCELLAQLDPDWNSSFDVTISLDERLYEALQ